MKTIIVLTRFFIALILVTGSFSCRQKETRARSHQGVEYFRHLKFSESPYDIETGTYPISPDEAANTNSYKFTYDDNGRLISVEYGRGGQLFDYSSMNGVAKVVYEYNGNMQTKFFYNSNSEPVELGGIFAWEYALDYDGNRVQMMFLGRDGSMIEDNNGIHFWNWTRLPDGKVKENRGNLKDEEVALSSLYPFYELRFTYDSKGYVTKMENYKNDSLYNCTGESCGERGVSYFTFTPDESGDVKQIEIFNNEGKRSTHLGWSKCVLNYDESGNVIQRSFYGVNDEPVTGDQMPVIMYDYDEHGALTEVRSYDSENNLKNNPLSGAAIIRYTYDDTGRLKGTHFLDSETKEIQLQ
jgi:YD repeat-containing protein